MTRFRPAAFATVVVLVIAAVAPVAAVGISNRKSADSLRATDDHGPRGGIGISSGRDVSRNGPPSVVSVYPNPVPDGDRGEFVVLRVPAGTDLGRYAISDDADRVALPNVTASGRIALTAAPALVRNLTDRRVVALPDTLALANGGGRLELRRNNATVASARYRDAPEAKVGRFDDRGAISWHRIGLTDRPVVAATGGEARAFVLPDAATVPIRTVRSADDRILLAGYTFTSERVARALRRAVDRGVTVRVLLEGEPVNGISEREARLLDSLVRAGVTVELLGGPRKRYAFHHAKYAVVDDRAVVLTENWKPSGTGGHSSRGWGAVVSQPRIVRGLATTFRADANWTAARPWREFRRGRSFSAGGAANGTYPARFDPKTVPVERTRLLVTPDNAAGAITSVIDGATSSVDVIQMRIDGPDQRFLRAVVRAARRGVRVRILLSSAWYVREDNRRLVERLRERASTEDLPLKAKLASPAGRYEKIHAKGAIIDGDQVLLGSLNWNGESVRRNREVVLQLDGDAVGTYYRKTFDADWGKSKRSSLPLGSIAAVGGVIVLALLVARRIEFGATTGVRPGSEKR